MRVPHDFEDKKKGHSLLYMGLGGFLCIITVFGFVMLTNLKPAGHASVGTPAADSVRTPPAEEREPLFDNTTRSEDLDFWHMYDRPQQEEVPEIKPEPVKEEEEDPSKGGSLTKLTLDGGAEEWVTVNPYITKNHYKSDGFVYQYPIMRYYEDSQKASYTGISLNEDSGNVNFSKLKKAGIDFVMLRLGSRAYGSGNVMADSKFYDYLNAAQAQKLDVGVTFFSQAITSDEAIEEAVRVIEGLQGYTITYPIAFDMEYINNDTARVQILSKEQKTEIADTFLKAVATAGYKGILYGDKEWLIRKLDLTKLSAYDVWLSQESDVPDYPYKYNMWEYSKNAKIDGVANGAKLSVCFVDYKAK